jgi:tRNA threonylcarbamoyladenosine modification (KEOPS) complex Cgi121 subunit
VLQVAVFKALHSRATNTLKCRNIYSEILYNLHPSFNMREAFKVFGVNPEQNNVIILQFPFSVGIPEVGFTLFL